MPEPIQAGLWGLLAASALLLGAVAALTLRVPRRIVALVMAFGAGALVSALAFDLAEEAFRVGGTLIFGLGLAAGAVMYYAGDKLIDRMGGRHANQPARPTARPSCSACCSTGFRNRSFSGRRSSVAPGSARRSSPRSPSRTSPRASPARAT